MKRKIVTLEVETEATNKEIKGTFEGSSYRVSETEYVHVKQVTVNDVTTTPKAAKKKARGKR